MKKLSLPAGATRAISRQVLVGRKNAPQILFVAGITGFVGTTILASRATLKVGDVLDTHEVNMAKIEEAQEKFPEVYSAMDVRSDTVKVYAGTALDITKLYGPALVVGTASIVCLSKSHSILSKRNAALGAAYAALDTSFRQYRARIREEVGHEREYELYRSSEENALTLDGRGNSLDELSGLVKPPAASVYSRWFAQGKTFSWEPVVEMNVTFLRAQQIYLNDKLKARGHVFLNEAYDCLGLSRTPEGAVVGWIYGADGNDYIDFGIWGGSSRLGGFNIDPDTGKSAILLDFNVDGVIWNHI